MRPGRATCAHGCGSSGRIRIDRSPPANDAANPAEDATADAPLRYDAHFFLGRLVTLLVQFLEINVSEGDFHRIAGVQLPGDDSVVGHLGELFIDGGDAVDLDGDVLADATDVVIVEAVLFQDLVDFVARRFLHHAPEMLAVEAAPIVFADVALRAFDGEVLVVENFAADLHAAVSFAFFEPDLEFQLEVLVFLVTAQKGVELEPVRRGADNGPFLDLPVLQAFPAVEVSAVEKVAVRGTRGHAESHAGQAASQHHGTHGISPAR